MFFGSSLSIGHGLTSPAAAINCHTCSQSEWEGINNFFLKQAAGGQKENLGAKKAGKEIQQLLVNKISDTGLEMSQKYSTRKQITTILKSPFCEKLRLNHGYIINPDQWINCVFLNEIKSSNRPSAAPLVAISVLHSVTEVFLRLH